MGKSVEIRFWSWGKVRVEPPLESNFEGVRNCPHCNQILHGMEWPPLESGSARGVEGDLSGFNFYMKVKAVE